MKNLIIAILLCVPGSACSPAIMEHLHIVGDTFNYVGGLTPHAAIELDNSEGFIQGNDIEGNFDYGIVVTGAGGGLSPYTNSLICSNTIKGSAGGIAGIATDYTQGYSKLNYVNVPGTGHICGINDEAHIIFSNYGGSGGSGISVTNKFAEPDLSGVHSGLSDPHGEDYAAFDTIWSNAGPQISLVKNSKIFLGTGLEVLPLYGGWLWSDWCHNNIVTFWYSGGCGCMYGDTAGGHEVPIIDADSGHSNTTDIGNISRNYFGDSIFILPEHDTVHGISDTFGSPSSWVVGGSGPNVAIGIQFNADSNFTSWQTRVPGEIDCEESMPITKSKGANPESHQIDTIYIPCQQKFAIGVSYNDGEEYDSGYKYLMEYAETCYDTGQAWHVFPYLDNSVADMNSDPARYENYRDWLKSILWLNTTDPEWYCACAEAIYWSYEAIDGGANLNATLAVIRYLDSAKRCQMDSVDIHASDSEILAERHMLWLDTIRTLHNGNPTGFPEDTTILTIDDLGLQILRGPPAAVDTSSSPQTGIGALTASENPFTKETTVSFSMGEYAYISFQVFDVLGTVMEGDYKGTVIGPGEHSFTVDGTNWPAGTYYARITTPIGETRMIKLVKE